MGKNTGIVQKKWTCLSINERYSSHLYYEHVLDDIKKIFSDCSEEDILFIGNKLNEKTVENALATYAFVRCENIYGYRQLMEKSRYVNGVLNSFDNIVYVDDKEIEELKKDWKRQKTIEGDSFYYGDVVAVKSGTYEKLNGIVVDEKNQKQLVIFFKFNIGCHIAILHKENLIRKNNVFEIIKVPYTEDV